MVQILLEFVRGLISLSTRLMWATLLEENPGEQRWEPHVIGPHVEHLRAAVKTSICKLTS